jgi:lysophospholipase L1-like esterase
MLQLLSLIPLFFVLAGFGQQPVVECVPTVQPIPRTGDAYERFLKLNENVRANAGQVDLVFIGDSITQGWEGAGKAVWQTYYGHRRALNLGIGGDRTQHVLWRLENGNIDGIQPKVGVLMIGTNNSGYDRDAPGAILDGVQAVVQKLRSKLPQMRIILVGIFPRGDQFNEQRGKILQVNQVLQRMDDGKSIHYIDFGQWFLDDEGRIPKDLMPDFLHLTETGYKIWAESIEDKVSSLLGDRPIKPTTN